jgi:hypothetical protein
VGVDYFTTNVGLLRSCGSNLQSRSISVNINKEVHERGVKPEQLPPAEDVNKLKRKLDNDDKAVVQKHTTCYQKEKVKIVCSYHED